MNKQQKCRPMYCDYTLNITYLQYDYDTAMETTEYDE